MREELPVQVSPRLFVHLMWLICEYQGGGGGGVDCRLLTKTRKKGNFKGLDGNRSRRQESEGGAALSKNISMILEAGTSFRFYLLIVVFRGRKNNVN